MSFITNTTTTLDNSQSNDSIIKLIQTDKPFLICRLSHIETLLSVYYDIHKTIHPQYKKISSTNAGIYSQNDKELELYSMFYMKSLNNMTKLACFPKLYTQTQNYVIQKYNIPQENILHHSVLEPFYQLHDDINSIVWTHLLKNKKILIVNPFVDSFQKQIQSGFKFFGKDDPRTLWDKDQKFVFYKSYNCIYNNHPHNSWFETYAAMCDDIKHLDFDIALLGCGGYGLPLCNFIYDKLGKSAIYMGGSIQLLFGVYGNRWKSHNIIGPLIQKGGWIRPSKEEQPTNFQKVEGGCYW
jgi:hypothetical protein